jgi:two-component system, NarL family, nitrate/nitrite response regulator NarL
MTSSPRTILIEPNRLFRQGLKHLLSGTCFEVGAEFNTVELALEAGETAGTPDLVISGQPVKDEAELHALREAFPTARIVVLADDLSVDVLRAAMGGGADGFLIKTVSPEALIQSLQLVMLGEKVFPTNLAAMLLDMTAVSPPHSIRGLSPREHEILQALVTGASNKMIAIKLGIMEAT